MELLREWATCRQWRHSGSFWKAFYILHYVFPLCVDVVVHVLMAYWNHHVEHFERAFDCPCVLVGQRRQSVWSMIQIADSNFGWSSRILVSSKFMYTEPKREGLCNLIRQQAFVNFWRFSSATITNIPCFQGTIRSFRHHSVGCALETRPRCWSARTWLTHCCSCSVDYLLHLQFLQRYRHSRLTLKTIRNKSRLESTKTCSDSVGGKSEVGCHSHLHAGNRLKDLGSTCFHIEPWALQEVQR